MGFEVQCMKFFYLWNEYYLVLKYSFLSFYRFFSWHCEPNCVIKKKKEKDTQMEKNKINIEQMGIFIQ